MFSEQRLYKVIAHFLIWIQLLTPGLSLMPLVARAQEPAAIQSTVQGLNSLILEQGPAGNTPPDPATPAALPALEDGAGGTTRPEPAPRAAAPAIATGKTQGENGYFHLQTLRDQEAPTLSGLPDLALPSEAAADKKDTPKDKTADADEGANGLSSGATQMATLFAGEDRTEAAVNYARGLGEGLINQQINDWLNQYGNAKVSVGTQQKLSGDLLVPLYETDERLIFTQVGTRTNEDRNTVNLGVGYRQYLSDWMLGVNTFYDYDYTGKNKRIGVGTEAWADYLKLAANGYIRQTNWHQSSLDGMEDYDERPANGFDLRANAYLPAWPNLGGSLKYEQYFGSGVSMADSASPDDLKDNPVVVTAGLDYTPFPLITVSAKRSVGDSNETSVGFDLNYRFGTPWYEQVSPDTVGLMRSLAGSKYDFVDRNYDIVMQYRKQDLLHIELPAGTTAQAAETVPVELTVSRAKYGLKGVEWTVDPQLTARGGRYKILSPTRLEVTLPAYDFSRDPKVPQTYKISAVASDNNGNASNTAETTISVIPSENVVGNPVLSPDSQSLVANNTDFYTVSALVTDGKGAPLANQPLTFSLEGLMNSSGQAGTLIGTQDGSQSDSRQVKMTTQASGQASVRVRSTVAGQGQITARMDNGNASVSRIVFVGDKTTAAVRQVRLNDSVNYKTADPQNSFTYTAQVQDGNGNPLSDVKVTWSKDVQQGVTLSAATSTTDNDGNATVRLLGSARAVSDITVSAGSDGQPTALDADKKVSFIAGDVDPGKSTFAASAGTITANGVATSALTLTLMDTNANPVTGAAASLRVVTAGVDHTQVAAFTEGSPGAYSATFSGTRAGTATLTAMSGQKTASAQTPVITLTADSNTARIAQADLVIDPDGSPADGKAANRVTATVTDAYANPVQGAVVTFNVTGGAVVTPASATSGAGGAVTALVTSTTAGSVDVGATVLGRQTTGKTHFVADVSTARVSTVALSGTVTSRPANGTDGFVYTVKVVDAHDNAVPGAVVTAAKDHNEGVLSASNNGQTDANGEVTLTLTSTQAMADVKVSAGVGKTTAVNADKAVSFVADSTTATVRSLTVATDNAAANGVATDAVTVTVTDANNNPVANAVVSLSADHGATAVAAVTTGIDGTATGTLTSKTAGPSTVTASLNQSSQSVRATFVADGATAAVTGLTVTTDGAVADGVATDAVTVTVQDANNNPVAGAVVSLSADHGATAVAAVTTGIDGTATGTLTSKTAGPSTVTASLNQSSQSASATFVSDSATAAVTGLTVTTDGAVANGVATDAVTVTVQDANNNPVAGVKVSLSADHGATAVTTVTTGIDGSATATLTSKTAGPLTVTASLGASSQSASATFVADDTTAAVTGLAMKTDNAVADDAATDAVTVTVQDANSNPVPNALVALSADNATIAATVTTGPDGTATVTLTSLKAVASTVTASLNQSSQSASATFVADGTTAVVNTLSVTTDNAVADGVATDAVTVTVQDANSNPVAGAKVSLIADNATIVASVTTDTDGSATATLTSKTAGPSTVTASLNQSSQSASATFVADISTAHVGVVTLTDSATTKIANSTDSFTYTARVVDANGNLITQPGVKVSWTQDKLDAVVLSSAESEINGNGEATVQLTSTLALVADVAVSAQYGATPVIAADKRVAFTYGEPASVTIKTTDGATTAVAGTQPSLAIEVVDAYGHTLPNQTVSLTVSGDKGGKPSIYPASVSSNAQGVVATQPLIADTTAEGVTVTGTVAANKATGTVVIRFTPDAVSSNTSTISAAPASIVADTLSTSTLLYVPKDRYGNVIDSIQTSSITSDVVGMNAADVSLSSWASGNGQYTATLKAGSVTGSLKVIPVINGQDGVSRSGDDILTLTAGQLDVSKSTITAAPNFIIADGKATTSLRFVPKDVFGNVISTLDVNSISQVITGTATDSTVGGWRYNANSQWYTATLTAGVMVGPADIMPTVAGNNAAAVGVSNTLSLQYSSSVKDIQSSSTGTAVADGVTTNTVTVTVYGDNQQVKASQPVTITPPNTELLINGNSGAYSGTTNSAGQLTVTMSSTLSGENDFTVESDQYNQTGTTTFGMYVSPTLSSLNFDKTDMYNNGADVMKVTFAPRDAKNRPIAGIPVSVTSTDTGATLSRADYQTQVTSTSSPSTYFITVKMSNYTLWQPEETEYRLIPTSGVKLATLTVQPKLCGKLVGSGFACTPTPANDGSYDTSELGFVVKVIERNAIWDNKMTLTSSDVDGALTINGRGNTKNQNCSAPVSQPASWMNDFGSKINGVDYTMSMDFSNESVRDTYDLGIKPPGTGGGIGLCNLNDWSGIKPDLSGAGSVIFVAATTVPVSSNRFSVPLTGNRIDAGLVGKPMTVYIYSD